MGLRDFSGNLTDFRWTSNSARLTFTNWARSQPSVVGYDCGIVILDFTDNGDPVQWYNAPCSEQLQAVCEADRVSGNR